MLILVMGVCGSGKTAVGKELSVAVGYEFKDADRYHPSSNKTKMSAGIPLTDEDRQPWLESIRSAIEPALNGSENIVLACSALKQRYRDFLMREGEQFKIIFLNGTKELLLSRLKERGEHFMNPELLDSQLADLEKPENSLTLNIESPVDALTEEIRRMILI